MTWCAGVVCAHLSAEVLQAAGNVGLTKADLT